MCGIAGAVDLSPGLESSELLVASMTDALSHRGLTTPACSSTLP